ncbi:ABC transporter ATP-binding/permease protein like [Heracleum sosnowskyi]|uniref:ABC transporter ATP-binding/permease protein like n=1 Tax=Heracleum sosnowskyi TaxID=360622 RepID=A0AAD8J4T6_9APIA|nr:ABC transporter ATP-binding/permease protein like [Heracleum sosnowskyi]
MEGDAANTTTTTTTTTTTNSSDVARVQHITKASSDELLSKFAQVGGTNKLAITLVNKNKKLNLSKRQRTINRSNADGSVCESPSSVSVADRKSLLPPANKRATAAVMRRLGIGKANLRSRNHNNKSLLGTIEKTWRKTLKGASKILIEKHYNRHKRLISDIA